jgi:hypothetical protein
VDNCQSGVFIGYSSGKGYGLLTSQLYMPKEWFSAAYAQRRADTLVPEDLPFQTKPQIALSLIQKIVGKNSLPLNGSAAMPPLVPTPLSWLLCPKSSTTWPTSVPKPKSFYENPKWVFLPIPAMGGAPRGSESCGGNCSQRPWLKSPSPARPSGIPWFWRKGAKGPIRADIACLRVFPAHGGLPQENSVWLLIRRTADGQIKYAFSNAPGDMPLSELTDASTLRWGIEQCLKMAKAMSAWANMNTAPGPPGTGI